MKLHYAELFKDINAPVLFILKFIAFTIIIIFCALALNSIGSSIYTKYMKQYDTLSKGITVAKAYNESLSGISAPKDRYKKFTTIIIDAGHGGEDPGASANGVQEKDINLNIAKNLQCLFALTDIKPVLTRSEDRLLYNEGQETRKKYYDLRNRVDIANTYENAIFLSIHQNKFAIKKYRGFQVYYSKNNPESGCLADFMQNGIISTIQPENTRKTKTAGSEILVLHRLKMPAVLAECGFLSNSDEAQLLSSEKYQKKLAFAIFVSVMQYLYE